MAAALIVVLGLMALFPQKYRVVATMAPTDPSSLGLGAALGQLGAYSTVFGSQAAIEVGLRVARSQAVRALVIQRMDLQKRKHFANTVDTDRWLTHSVDVRALRGGVLQIDTKTADPALGIRLIDAYVDATRDELGIISRNQTAYKRKILTQLVADSGDQLARAQAAYDSFRRQSRFAEPQPALAAIGTRVPAIEQMLKSKEVELQQARTFATDQNMAVRQILAEMDALQSQLTEAKSLDVDEPNSVNRVVEQSTQVKKLMRDLNVAQGLYDNYRLYLQGTSVEDLASTGTIRIIETPYVDTARQYNMMPVGLLALVLMSWLAMEFYLMRPPLGAIREIEPR